MVNSQPAPNNVLNTLKWLTFSNAFFMSNVAAYTQLPRSTK